MTFAAELSSRPAVTRRTAIAEHVKVRDAEPTVELSGGHILLTDNIDEHGNVLGHCDRCWIGYFGVPPVEPCPGEYQVCRELGHEWERSGRIEECNTCLAKRPVDDWSAGWPLVGRIACYAAVGVAVLGSVYALGAHLGWWA